MVRGMKIDLPGLMREKMASGNYRYRVRMEGDKAKKTTLSVTPDHPDFMDHYSAARQGVKIAKVATPLESATPRSVSWLTHAFEDHMRRQVSAGHMQMATYKQRAAFFARVRKDYGQKHMEMPRSAVIEIRDKMAETPGAANNMVKSIRALYTWASETGYVFENPAFGVSQIGRSTGATPWSVEDLKAFRERHTVGTTAHLALTLFMFTACRIGDAVLMGRANEKRRDGLTWLDWQPEKRGSARVVIPILPPLAKAISSQTVVGPTYLLSGLGQPFASKSSFGNWFRDRVREAGLRDRSAHGIRKAAGELMALEGATQYHIMAVHGHTQAKTSEVYTSGVNRAKLAKEALQMMAGMEW